MPDLKPDFQQIAQIAPITMMPDRLSFSKRSGAVILGLCVCTLGLAALAGCASLPDPKFKKFSFPKNAFIGDVQRPYTVLGPVRSKVDYQTLDFNREEKDLCRNYFNRAVRDLVKYAKKQGADAVVDVKSVVFLVDGRTESYATPECSDDGGEGQVLTQGVAVKWKGGPVETGAWTQAPQPRQPAVTLNPPALPPAAAGAATAQLPAPSAKNPNAPVFPEGGTLVPEQDEPQEPAKTAATANESEAAPVSVRMESFDPQKNLLSSPSRPAGGPAPASVPEAPEPASKAPPAPPVYYQSQTPAVPSGPRLPFADPRAVPGTFQKAFP